MNLQAPCHEIGWGQLGDVNHVDIEKVFSGVNHFGIVKVLVVDGHV